ncbi:MAG: hypothetical protein WDN49_07095 [Acetobacteraceae bacterium]
MVVKPLAALLLLATLATLQPAAAASPGPDAATGTAVEPLDAPTLASLKDLYKQLIDAENRHDLAAVRPLVWVSPSTLFVAKTATPGGRQLGRVLGDGCRHRTSRRPLQGGLVPDRPGLQQGESRRLGS